MRHNGRSLTLVLTCLMAAATAQAQMGLGEWEALLNATDGPYIQARESHRQALLDERAKRLKWLPTLSATPGASLSTGSQGFSLGLNLSQASPFGGSLSAGFTQNLDTEGFTPDSFSYRASGSLSLSQPLPYFGYGSLHAAARAVVTEGGTAHSVAEATWEAARTRRIATSIKALLDAAVLARRIEVGEALISWHEASLETSRILFDSGRLSAMDFAQARERAQDARTAQDKRRRELLTGEAARAAWGIDPSTLDPEAWLDCLESDIARCAPRSAAEWELMRESSSLSETARSQADAHLSSMPVLSASCSLSPGPPVAGKADTARAFTDYWTGELPFDWSLNLSVTLPLTPWSSAWSIDAKARSQAASLRSQRADLERQAALHDERARAAAALAREAVERADRTLSLERDRLELYRIRRASGDLSALDLAYQEIQVRSAELDLLSARVEALCAALVGE